MNAKELMVGDWVKVLPISSKCEEHYEQVVDSLVYNNKRYIEGYGFSVTEDYIEPIPLTAEILELNGFEILIGRYDIKRYRIIDNDMVVVVEPMKIESRLGNSWFWVTINHRGDVVQPRIIYPLAYVHTFQHILRDSGLNELADNFKVEKGE